MADEQTTGLDTEGQSLRDAGEAAGRLAMEDSESAPEESETRAPDTVAEVETPKGEQANNSDAEAESQSEERPRDEQGRFVKKPDDRPSDSPKEEPKAADDGSVVRSQDSGKQESDYEKARKEADRRDRSWKALEEEKARERAAIAAERALIERERAQLQQQMQQRQQQNGQRAKDEYGNDIYSSEEYRNFARLKRTEAAAKLKEGDYEEAQKAITLAEQSEQAVPVAQQREARSYEQQFEQEKTRLALEVLKEEPELADVNSPLSKEMQAVFAEELQRSTEAKRPSVFALIPDGFRVAKDVAKLRLEAASASELKAKIATMETELKRLREATSIGGSSPTRHAGPKKIEEMEVGEMSGALKRAAEEADRELSMA